MFDTFKRLKHYIKIVKNNIDDLSFKYSGEDNVNSYKILSIKYDKAYRIYTVLNFDTKLYEKYDNRYIDMGIRKFVRDFLEDLNKLGLREMVKIRPVIKVGESSALVSFEFKDINIAKWKIILYSIGILTIFALSLSTIIMLI